MNIEHKDDSNRNRLTLHIMTNNKKASASPFHNSDCNSHGINLVRVVFLKFVCCDLKGIEIHRGRRSCVLNIVPKDEKQFCYHSFQMKRGYFVGKFPQLVVVEKHDALLLVV